MYGDVPKLNLANGLIFLGCVEILQLDFRHSHVISPPIKCDEKELNDAIESTQNKDNNTNKKEKKKKRFFFF